MFHQENEDWEGDTRDDEGDNGGRGGRRRGKLESKSRRGEGRSLFSEREREEKTDTFFSFL